jgi:DNA-binding transcriptional regulator YiaG
MSMVECLHLALFGHGATSDLGPLCALERTWKAANLRRLRNAKGLSQDDVAYEAGMSRSYLSKLEKGARRFMLVLR